MDKDRLSALALLSMERTTVTNADIDAVITKFIKMKQRRKLM